MSTIQEVAAALGDEAQVCGGSVVVYRGGVHILVAETTETGFEVTPAGKDILGSTVVTEDGNTVILAKPKKSKVEAPEIKEVVEAIDPLAGL